MNLVVIPTMDLPDPLDLSDSSFRHLGTVSRSALVATRELPAAERRLLVAHFDSVQWEAVRPPLPLRLAFPTEVRPWRARLCRSHYVWRPPEDIHSSADLDQLDKNLPQVCKLAGDDFTESVQAPLPRMY